MERQRVDELLEMNMSMQMDLKRSSYSADVTRSVTHPHVLYSELESDEELQELKSPENHGDYIEHHFLILCHDFMPNIISSHLSDCFHCFKIIPFSSPLIFT